jgi:hypothetical protein
MHKVMVLLMAILMVALLVGCATIPYTGTALYRNEVPGGPNTNRAPNEKQVKEGVASLNNVRGARPYVPVKWREEGIADSNKEVDISHQSMAENIIWHLLGGRVR